MSLNLKTLEHMGTWKALAIGLREELLLHGERTLEAERLLAVFDELMEDDPETFDEFKERHAVMWGGEFADV